MKKRIFSAVCVFLFIISLTSVGAVEPRASDYFWCTDVYASAAGNGKVLVEIEIVATHTMTQVGAQRVYIYEQQSDGDYEIVHTFDYTTQSGMMSYGSAFYDGALTYQGTSGVKYFATACLYAKDSSGSETMFVDSYVITA